MKGQRSGREGVGSQLRAALGKLLSVVCPPIVIIALLTGYSVAAIYAQEGSSSDTGVTLSTSSELVLVPVQVRNSNGKPVHGLQKNDFVLRTDGKVQPVTLFEQASASADNDRSINPSAAAARSDEFSNVPSAGMPHHLLIIAIDHVNTPFKEQAWARQALLKYFANNPPEQPFALVAITKDGLVQIHSFSSDPKAILGAIQSDHPAAGKAEQKHDVVGELSLPKCGLCATDAAEFRGSVEAKAVDATILSFVQLEQAYAGIPGRKSLIWLSADMPHMQEIAAILNRGNIALYPVNLRGLQTDNHLLGEEALIDPMTPSEGSTSQPLSTAPPTEDNGMRQVASETGGRYCSAMTELKSCISNAVEDSSDYYMLGFYISQHDRKPGWHKLEVKLASGRGKIYSRAGYYLAPKTTFSEEEILGDLRIAANARIPFTGIVFSVERRPISPTTAAASNDAIGFRIRVPASSVVLQSGRQKLSYEVAIVPLSEKGAPMNAPRITRLDLTAAQTETALTKGWSYDEQVQKTASLAAVKLIIRDNGSGNIGSVIVPLIR